MLGRLPWIVGGGLVSIGKAIQRAGTRVITSVDDWEGWEWTLRGKVEGLTDKCEVLMFGEVIDIEDDDDEGEV